ncbi:MAG: hypothetical protein RBS37_06525 [Bacteroidales bacterium]|jgi:hypothetical protein|nr:hypothetical protein [Bacteroidales bacterium]
MPNFPDVMSKILGVVFMLLVFSIAYAYLKPHRMHKRRPLSTFLLKSSYLAYLIVLLIIVFLASFYRDGLSSVFADVEFFAFLVVLFAPTIGIFARKLGYFSKRREEYNYFFMVVNLVSIIALLLMFRF